MSTSTGADYPKEATYQAATFEVGCTVQSYCVYNAQPTRTYYIYSGEQTIDLSDIAYI